MVAEKPSMAQELANMLAQGARVNRSSCMFFFLCPISESAFIIILFRHK